MYETIFQVRPNYRNFREREREIQEKFGEFVATGTVQSGYTHKKQRVREGEIICFFNRHTETFSDFQRRRARKKEKRILKNPRKKTES